MVRKDAKIDIRKANTNDVQVLSALVRDSFRDVAERFNLTPENCPTHPSNCTDEWIVRDLNREVIYYILESDSIPLGCVALEKAETDLCYLERLGVLPTGRRRGFGKALVDHVFAEAWMFNAKKVSIGIIAEDVQLKRWYQRMGFVEQVTKEFPHLPFDVTFLIFEL